MPDLALYAVHFFRAGEERSLTVLPPPYWSDQVVPLQNLVHPNCHTLISIYGHMLE